MLPSTSSPILLDGATGTELGRRGADISPPLWSARAIIDAPDLIEQIHREYLDAGADAIIANTFRTHRRTIERAGLGTDARELTWQAVEIARRARDAVNPDALVLGSLAPLEDCYKPDAAPSFEQCAAEHGEMLDALVAAGVDGIMIETMGTLREAQAAAEVARRRVPQRWMISMLTTSSGPPGLLISGESLIDLLPALEGALAVGVNCVTAAAIEPQVRLLRRFLPEDVRIVAYGNTGRMAPDGRWTTTDAAEPERYAEYSATWLAAGASIVGGCCGTTPETIRMIARRLRPVE